MSQAVAPEAALAFSLTAARFFVVDKSAKALRAECVRLARLLAPDPALDDEAAVRAAGSLVEAWKRGVA